MEGEFIYQNNFLEVNTFQQNKHTAHMMVLMLRHAAKANDYRFMEGITSLREKLPHHTTAVFGGTPDVNVGNSPPASLGSVLA